MENPSKFCSACGNGLVATAVICPACGSKVSGPKGPKKKYVAVLLAVFFSYWSWLYTSQKNLKKFFIGLGLSVVAGVVIGINQAAISTWASDFTQCFIYNIDNGTDYDCFELYPSNPLWSTLIQAGWVTVAGVYIWAIIDNARRSSDYYSKYAEQTSDISS